MKKSFISFTAGILAALSVFTFAGCRTNKVKTPAKESTSIIRFCGEWKLVSYSGFESIPEAYMNITWVDDIESGEELSVNGYSGVNSFFSTIKDNNSFPLGHNVGSTKMMGAPEDMEFEDAFLDTLCNAKDWKVSGRTLTITDGDKTAVFQNTYVSDK